MKPGGAPALLWALALPGLAGCLRSEAAASAPVAAAPVAAAPVTAALDCRKPAHRISPLIYGVGYNELPAPDEALPWELGATARRWGGNSSSRYNWRLGNAWNTGSDWFFRNVSYGGGKGPAYARFLEENRAHGVASALTVPLIGWVAKDTVSASFPVSRFGPQRAADHDAGDGLSAEGKPLAPGPPEQTSVAAPPSMIEAWVRRIRADGGGVRMYLLDNEPMLWHETHRDVHPQPVTYDELLDRTLRYGAAVRSADPRALIAGPALWGWPAYGYSAADARAGFALHPDRRAHGDVPLLPWYLRKLREQEQKTGVHLLDVVDVHFYPQADGIGGAHGRTEAEFAARRLRSVRGLWDASYSDESYIGEPIRLLPRLREWIDENDPGLGISIGEWNFGAARHPSGGLATAEALGRFAEAGITAAFYWTAPPRGSPAFWAFRAFRDFDGAGAAFEDLFAGAVTQDRLSVFISRNQAATRLVLVAVNGRDSAAEVRLRLEGCGAPAAVRRFVAAGADFTLRAGDRLTPSQDAPALLPPQSISVVEVQLASGR